MWMSGCKLLQIVIIKKQPPMHRLYEIVPHLYLSDYQCALAASPSEAFIVNCTKDLPMVRVHNMRISVDDDGSREAMESMFQSLPEAVERIQEMVIGKGIPVVVHCHAGQQRSPTVVAAYLMHQRLCCTVEDAIRFVRCKKPDAFFWTANFRDALERYHRYLFPGRYSRNCKT
jgi:hypothetical protein